MQHFLPVQVLQCGQKSTHYLFGQSFWAGMSGVAKVIPERSSFTIFRDDVVSGALVNGFVHLDDVGVIEARKSGDFVEK